jgi:hypothetical protein
MAARPQRAARGDLTRPDAAWRSGTRRGATRRHARAFVVAVAFAPPFAARAVRSPTVGAARCKPGRTHDKRNRRSAREPARGKPQPRAGLAPLAQKPPERIS